MKRSLHFAPLHFAPLRSAPVGMTEENRDCAGVRALRYNGTTCLKDPDGAPDERNDDHGHHAGTRRARRRGDGGVEGAGPGDRHRPGRRDRAAQGLWPAQCRSRVAGDDPERSSRSARSPRPSPRRAWRCWSTRVASTGASPSATTSRNSGCTIRSPRTGSPCATCFAITAACRAMTGSGCRAVSLAPRCCRPCATSSRAGTFEPTFSTAISATTRRASLRSGRAALAGRILRARDWPRRWECPMTFTAEDLAAADDAAAPYAMHRDQRQRTRLWPIRATAAGAINTSITAIANWMTFLLGEGAFKGARLLSPALVRELQVPRVHAGRAGLRRIRSQPLWPGLRVLHLSRRAGRRTFRRLDRLEHVDAADARPEAGCRRVYQPGRSAGSQHPDQPCLRSPVRQGARALARPAA